MKVENDKRLTRKELAAALGVTRQYVWAMEKKGFVMIASRATYTEAMEWLAYNHTPTSGVIGVNRARLRETRRLNII